MALGSVCDAASLTAGLGAAVLPASASIVPKTCYDCSNVKPSQCCSGACPSGLTDNCGDK